MARITLPSQVPPISLDVLIVPTRNKFCTEDEKSTIFQRCVRRNKKNLDFLFSCSRDSCILASGGQIYSCYLALYSSHTLYSAIKQDYFDKIIPATTVRKHYVSQYSVKLHKNISALPYSCLACVTSITGSRHTDRHLRYLTDASVAKTTNYSRQFTPPRFYNETGTARGLCCCCSCNLGRTIRACMGRTYFTLYFLISGTHVQHVDNNTTLPLLAT